ncbi:histidine kinase [Bacillus manliponensis]|uniref:histidine kinase n=1 Tax=Bacillus manliponensis TaxID=574376 RepID=UPI0035182C77
MNMMQFIQTYIGKNNEIVDELYIRKEHDITVITLIKQTARTIRKTAEIFVSEGVVLETPTEIITIFHTPNVKKKESELVRTIKNNELIHFVEKGILIKEVRFQKDGKTVADIFYRMGLGLFQYMERIRQEQERKEREELLQWTMEKAVMPSYVDEYTEKLASVCNKMEEAIEQGLPVLEIKRWPHEKVLLWLQFLLAFYKIRVEKQKFDWKEIGAAYYRTIGGSKKFDTHKKEFLNVLEELTDVPPHCFGLISLGTVTPIFFCGNVREGDVQYPCDTVRSLTDLTVFRYEYETDASVLWLVENRAILTRMAAEEGFLKETNSLVIGVDGQLRSGHKKLIKSILSHSKSIVQVIIWTDYDKSGQVISDSLFEVVVPYNKRIKWIAADGQVLNKAEYENQLFKGSEQEEQLGGEMLWKTWINR